MGLCRGVEEGGNGSAKGSARPCLAGCEPLQNTATAVIAPLLRRDVRALGITLMGHQKKILGSIQTMRAQLSSTQGPRRHL